MFPMIPPTIPSSNVQWEKQKVANIMKQQLSQLEQSYTRPKPAKIPFANCMLDTKND